MSNTEFLRFCRQSPTGSDDRNLTRRETNMITSRNPTGSTSWQLSRWSRVRSIRSHRRLGFPALAEKIAGSNDPALISSPSPSCSSTSSAVDVKEQNMNGTDGFVDGVNRGKEIYMVSDGTGWTAEHSVYATLLQIQHCHGNKRCPVNTHLFSGVQDMEHLMEIIRRAATDSALLLYTLADPTLAAATKHSCQQLGVRSADILRPTSEVIAEHLGVAPSVTPPVDSGGKGKLADNYSQLIHDAVEFTLMHDDGARADDISEAHIVLVGVSRTGKTPLSIYLSQKGYKVANIPMVTGMDLPRSLSEIDQDRIFGLTVSATVLQQVRMERAKELGFLGSNYSAMDHVRKELEHAHKIFAQNPSWPVIDVTGKAMEETAASIVRMYNDKKQKRLMPLISKRY